MLKSLISSVICLLIAMPLFGEPGWFVRHKRTIAVFAVNGAALGVSAAGLAHCRRGDVENCTAHYGNAWATFGAWAGVTGVVFPALAIKCWQSGDANALCYAIGYTGAAYQTAWGINEWHQYAPEKNDELKIHEVWLHVRR